MAQVKRSRVYDVAPDAMWSKIGDFHTMHSWHPMIVSSVPLGGGSSRELTLGDGAKVRETLIEEEPRSYTYRIDESPLPLRDYVSHLAVTDGENGGSEFTWTIDFEPHGAPEADVVALIGGLIDAGINSL